MKSINHIVTLLSAIALAALLTIPFARAEPNSNYRPVPEATAQASAGSVSDASELVPSTVDLGLTVAPSNPQVIAALVEQHNALRALMSVTVAPSHPAEIAALLQQEALRRKLAVEVAPYHPAEIAALIREYEAME